MEMSWPQFLLIFIGISSLVAFSWAVMIFFGIRSFNVGTKAFKDAKAQGKTDQEATEISLKAVKDLEKTRSQDQRFITAKHLLSRIGALFTLGFLGYFFTTWMSATALDWVDTQGGMIHRQIIYGLLIATSVLVVIRGFIKDPGPNWATLEQRLILISFFAVLLSCFGSVARILLTPSS
ncbi:hypothetical protein M0Q28_01050 [Patescibacteria group bacterium]|jgi:hypothetical protein|nr:hypothetical protein [Patescibacteria group bacterium]